MMPSPPRSYPSVPQQPPQYVDYLQQGRIMSSTPGGIRLASPAVIWASSVRQGTPRSAVLQDKRMLLVDQSGVQVVRTDLPLASKRLGAGGQFIGMAGHVACWFSGNTLQLADAGKGTMNQVMLNDVQALPGATLNPGYSPLAPQPVYTPPARPGANPVTPIPLQFAIDGPLVYVTGPGGILCLKAATASRVFMMPWPEGALPAAKTVNPAARASAPSPNVVYPPGSIPPPMISHSHISPVYFSSSMPMPMNPQQAVVTCGPTAGCVDRAVLYTLTSPRCVVALAERTTDAP